MPHSGPAASFLSAVHCSVFRDDSGTALLCREAECRNGLWLNGEMVQRGQRLPLNAGDSIGLVQETPKASSLSCKFTPLSTLSESDSKLVLVHEDDRAPLMKFQVRIPEGVADGASFEIDAGGSTMTVACMTGQTAGQYVEVAVPDPAQRRKTLLN